MKKLNSLFAMKIVSFCKCYLDNFEILQAGILLANTTFRLCHYFFIIEAEKFLVMHNRPLFRYG